MVWKKRVYMTKWDITFRGQFLRICGYLEISSEITWIDITNSALYIYISGDSILMVKWLIISSNIPKYNSTITNHIWGYHELLYNQVCLAHRGYVGIMIRGMGFFTPRKFSDFGAGRLMKQTQIKVNKWTLGYHADIICVYIYTRFDLKKTQTCEDKIMGYNRKSIWEFW